MVAQSAEFKKAAEESKKLKSKPTNDQLLKLYSLYKIGTGEDFSKATAPGMFDMTGKAKYNAWKAEVEAGTQPEEAQKKYVEFVEELKSKLGFNA
ncbi:Acyl-CoA-binding protein 1 [Cercospora beticola]|uniref:Acyl-CoA-binding protein 1 n=1 Tax=Cercospora beticola TaxID=122368 RepID=A0A2G5HLT0_CERBT|nr:Acyl-CoA-binding protein 1 [Cercospora beticola]PIA93511.1 Acyl-CoA-binding protein 1 [Cercospora beticola]WPB02031.1 hypothetical protein RHO25_006665 [Cercospora beticola]CAK1363117.1 unnamed protein product [Cercospora beticola]